MRIVMTFCVRDEADVLDLNLRVHRALGVDHFAVLDNGSTDATPEILEGWRSAGLAHVISDPDADTDEVFREWQTRLARLAATELEADWVINNDGDEFWWPLEGNLSETFSRVPPGSPAVLAPRLEFVPRPDGPEPFWERMIYREATTRVLPKVAHRALSDVRVAPGSHHVRSPSVGLPQAAGKPSLRGLRRKPAHPPVIAPAPVFPFAVFHLPLRSFEQYRSRLEIGVRIAETRSSERLAERIQAVLSPDEARARWQELVFDDDRAQAGVAAGELVEDVRLRDFARRLDLNADPVAIEPLVPEPLSGDALAATRADLARMALVGLSHNHAQALGERDALASSLDESRQRVKQLRPKLRTARRRSQERARKLASARGELRKARRRRRAAEQRLERITQSRWWRLRPRLRRRRKR